MVAMHAELLSFSLEESQSILNGRLLAGLGFAAIDLSVSRAGCKMTDENCLNGAFKTVKADALI